MGLSVGSVAICILASVSKPLQCLSIWALLSTFNGLAQPPFLWILWVSNNKDNFQQRRPPGTQFALGRLGGVGGGGFIRSKGTLRQTLISSRPVSLSVGHGGERDKPGELVSAYCRKNPFAWPPDRTKTP